MRAANPDEVKEAVRERDGFCCTQCGMTDDQYLAESGKQLDVHRLDPGESYTFSGCVTLCRSCHGDKPKSSRQWQDVKVDKDVIRIAKIAALIDGKHVYDWISDALNEAAAAATGRLPIVRKNFMPKRASRK